LKETVGRVRAVLIEMLINDDKENDDKEEDDDKKEDDKKEDDNTYQLIIEKKRRMQVSTCQ
jgi:hypothetical protein